MSIRDTSAQSGARLNYLYQQSQLQPNPDSQDALFTEILNYAERIITDFAMRESVPTGSVMDGVQEACLKVFVSLESFKSKSKFSTWVFPIVRNAFYDELRKICRRKEQPVSETKSYDKTAGKKPKTTDSDYASRPLRLNEMDIPMGMPFKRTASLFTKLEISKPEDKRILVLDQERFETSLLSEDLELFHDYVDGESVAVTAKRLGITTKRVYNRRQVIKNRMLQCRKSVPIARTISAKHAERLALGNRYAREFAKAYKQLEKQRWDKLTTTRPWVSDTQALASWTPTPVAKATLTAEHDICPKCNRKTLRVYEYDDGAKKYECSSSTCRYFMVFGGKTFTYEPKGRYENSSVFSSVRPGQQTSVGKTLVGRATAVAPHEGIFEPEPKEYPDTNTWNWSDVPFAPLPCSRVGDVDSSCACSACLGIRLTKYLGGKPLDTQLVKQDYGTEVGNLPEWVSKIPVSERLSIEEGLFLST